MICNKPYNSHTEPLFRSQEILPLPDLVAFFKLQFIQRFSQQFLPESFDDVWSRNHVRNIGDNDLQLRNNDHYRPPPSRLALTDRLPTFSFLKTWESFPDENIKFIRKKSEFDQKLKQYFIDDLSVNVTCNRLYCPACSLQA